MASQLGLPNTGTASLGRIDVEISPQQRGFGGGNRNVWEQMDSPEGHGYADKAPSHQVGCSSLAPSPWHLGKAHPQAPGTCCTFCSLPAPCRGELLAQDTSALSRSPGAHRLRFTEEAPALQSPSAPSFPRAPCDPEPGQLGHPHLGTRAGWWHWGRVPALPHTPSQPLPPVLLSCASTTCSHWLGQEGDRSDLTEVPGDEGQSWGVI